MGGENLADFSDAELQALGEIAALEVLLHLVAYGVPHGLGDFLVNAGIGKYIEGALLKHYKKEYARFVAGLIHAGSGELLFGKLVNGLKALQQGLLLFYNNAYLAAGSLFGLGDFIGNAEQVVVAKEVINKFSFHFAFWFNLT